MSRRIALLSAEPSGDLQAAALVSQLRRSHPDWTFYGVGGQHSRRAGLHLWADSTRWSIIGITEILSALPELLSNYWAVRQRLVRERPDLVVVIDSPALNMRIAGILQKHGIPCVYYFPPSAWTVKERRLRQIHERVSALVTAFAFNAEQYRRLGLEVAHFGHPLLELCPRLERAPSLAELELPEGNYVALLPGSRRHEVRMLLPDFLASARQLRQNHPDLHWILPTANPTIEAQVRELVGSVPEWLHIRSGRSRAAMAVSQVGLLASGTASLEASLLGLPHLLAYRLNPFDFFLGSQLVRFGVIKVGHFGLPNLVLQRQVVPELLQDQVQPEALTLQLERLLQPGEERRRALEDLAEVRSALSSPLAGNGSIIGHIAEFVARMAQGASRSEALHGL